MTDATARAAAKAMPDDITKEEIDADAERREADRRAAFSKAHACWLRVKADLAQPNKSDELFDALFEEERVAERSLMSAPAVDGVQLWQKLTALEIIATAEVFGGPQTDSVVMLGFGSIKDDLVSLNIYRG